MEYWKVPSLWGLSSLESMLASGLASILVVNSAFTTKLVAVKKEAEYIEQVSNTHLRDH